MPLSSPRTRRRSPRRRRTARTPPGLADSAEFDRHARSHRAPQYIFPTHNFGFGGGGMAKLLAGERLPISARPARLCLLMLAVLIAVAPVEVAGPARGASNPVTAENQKPGTSSWHVTKKSDDVHRQVKGYASATSINRGGSITFFVTVN